MKLLTQRLLSIILPLLAAACVHGDPVSPQEAQAAYASLYCRHQTMYIYTSLRAYGDIAQDSIKWVCK